MLARAALLLLFGIIILVWPGATTLALLIVFGAFALSDGLVSAVQSIYAAREGGKWGLLLGKGLVEILIAILVFARPWIALVALLYAIAIWAIVVGSIELVGAFEVETSSSLRRVYGMTGVLSMILGFLLLLFPGSGIFAIILFVGINSIIKAAFMVILSFMIRSWSEQELKAA